MLIDEGTRRRRLFSLTPLIDVVFLLLLFFMLASTFTRFAAVDVTLAGGSGPAGDAPLVLLTVAGEGRLMLDGEAVELAGLGAALKARAAAGPIAVMVRPVGAAASEDVVHALEAARAAEVGAVGLAR